ncbi:uncharacterized protein LOC126748101 isoform X2 [Anthonomus grandis grandis]|uniref:uncharacterized protein LOC126748101 isoform X2 n=1 Tax=Anthonomus grandis grandis TaxID=2921223 RepID=UPI00216590A3|nr:uncharacterized protein LOC126748101 isoform X2 [Anthonomus grandis grandis]
MSSEYDVTFCYTPFKKYDAILNDKSSAFESKVTSLIEVWKSISGLKHAHFDIKYLIQIIDWAKLHALNIVLTGEWRNIKEPVRNEFVTLLEFAQKSLSNVNDAFSARCQKLVDVVRQPWEDPILKTLIQDKHAVIGPTEIDFFCVETAYLVSVRLKKLCENHCEDLALNLVINFLKYKKIAVTQHLNLNATETQLWFIFDIYIALLFKFDEKARIIEEFNGLPLYEGVQLTKRFTKKRVKISKIWRKAVRVAVFGLKFYISKVLMNFGEKTDDNKVFLTQLIQTYLNIATDKDMLEEFIENIRDCTNKAADAEGLCHLVEIIHREAADRMPHFIIEMYIRALTTDMNHLERYKLQKDELKVKSTTSRLSGAYDNMAELLTDHIKVSRECALTAFSIEPTKERLEKLEELAKRSGYSVVNNGLEWKCRLHPPVLPTDEVAWICPECGDWMCKPELSTRRQVNTPLQEALQESILGISEALCDDLVVCLSNPRYQILSWSLSWQDLYRLCILYLNDPERTKNFVTELKFVDLDYSMFDHIKKEPMEEYTGIEKGYEQYLDAEFQSDEEDTSCSTASHGEDSASLACIGGLGSDGSGESSQALPQAKSDPKTLKSLRMFRPSQKRKQEDKDEFERDQNEMLFKLANVSSHLRGNQHASHNILPELATSSEINDHLLNGTTSPGTSHTSMVQFNAQSGTDLTAATSTRFVSKLIKKSLTFGVPKMLDSKELIVEKIPTVQTSNLNAIASVNPRKTTQSCANYSHNSKKISVQNIQYTQKPITHVDYSGQMPSKQSSSELDAILSEVVDDIEKDSDTSTSSESKNGLAATSLLLGEQVADQHNQVDQVTLNNSNNLTQTKLPQEMSSHSGITKDCKKKLPSIQCKMLPSSSGIQPHIYPTRKRKVTTATAGKEIFKKKLIVKIPRLDIMKYLSVKKTSESPNMDATRLHQEEKKIRDMIIADMRKRVLSIVVQRYPLPLKNLEKTLVPKCARELHIALYRDPPIFALQKMNSLAVKSSPASTSKKNMQLSFQTNPTILKNMKTRSPSPLVRKAKHTLVLSQVGRNPPFLKAVSQPHLTFEENSQTPLCAKINSTVSLVQGVTSHVPWIPELGDQCMLVPEVHKLQMAQPFLEKCLNLQPMEKNQTAHPLTNGQLTRSKPEHLIHHLGKLQLRTLYLSPEITYLIKIKLSVDLPPIICPMKRGALTQNFQRSLQELYQKLMTPFRKHLLLLMQLNQVTKQVEKSLFEILPCQMMLLQPTHQTNFTHLLHQPLLPVINRTNPTSGCPCIQIMDVETSYGSNFGEDTKKTDIQLTEPAHLDESESLSLEELASSPLCNVEFSDFESSIMVVLPGVNVDSDQPEIFSTTINKIGTVNIIPLNCDTLDKDCSVELFGSDSKDLNDHLGLVSFPQMATSNEVFNRQIINTNLDQNTATYQLSTPSNNDSEYDYLDSIAFEHNYALPPGLSPKKHCEEPMVLDNQYFCHDDIYGLSDPEGLFPTVDSSEILGEDSVENRPELLTNYEKCEIPITFTESLDIQINEMENLEPATHDDIFSTTNTPSTLQHEESDNYLRREDFSIQTTSKTNKKAIIISNILLRPNDRIKSRASICPVEERDNFLREKETEAFSDKIETAIYSQDYLNTESFSHSEACYDFGVVSDISNKPKYEDVGKSHLDNTLLDQPSNYTTPLFVDLEYYDDEREDSLNSSLDASGKYCVNTQLCDDITLHSDINKLDVTLKCNIPNEYKDCSFKIKHIYKNKRRKISFEASEDKSGATKIGKDPVASIGYNLQSNFSKDTFKRRNVATYSKKRCKNFKRDTSNEIFSLDKCASNIMNNGDLDVPAGIKSCYCISCDDISRESEKFKQELEKMNTTRLDDTLALNFENEASTKIGHNACESCSNLFDLVNVKLFKRLHSNSSNLNGNNLFLKEIEPILNLNLSTVKDSTHITERFDTKNNSDESSIHQTAMVQGECSTDLQNLTHAKVIEIIKTKSQLNSETTYEGPTHEPSYNKGKDLHQEKNTCTSSENVEIIELNDDIESDVEFIQSNDKEFNNSDKVIDEVIVVEDDVIFKEVKSVSNERTVNRKRKRKNRKEGIIGVGKKKTLATEKNYQHNSTASQNVKQADVLLANKKRSDTRNLVDVIVIDDNDEGLIKESKDQQETSLQNIEHNRREALMGAVEPASEKSRLQQNKNPLYEQELLLLNTTAVNNDAKKTEKNGKASERPRNKRKMADYAALNVNENVICKEKRMKVTNELISKKKFVQFKTSSESNEINNNPSIKSREARILGSKIDAENEDQKPDISKIDLSEGWSSVLDSSEESEFTDYWETDSSGNFSDEDQNPKKKYKLVRKAFNWSFSENHSLSPTPKISNRRRGRRLKLTNQEKPIKKKVLRESVVHYKLEQKFKRRRFSRGRTMLPDLVINLHRLPEFVTRKNVKVILMNPLHSNIRIFETINKPKHTPLQYSNRFNVDDFHTQTRKKIGFLRFYEDDYYSMITKVKLRSLCRSNLNQSRIDVPGLYDYSLLLPAKVNHIVNVVQHSVPRSPSTGDQNVQTSTQITPHIQRIGQPKASKSDESPAEKTSNSLVVSSSGINQSSFVNHNSNGPRPHKTPDQVSRQASNVNILSQQVIRPGTSQNHPEKMPSQIGEPKTATLLKVDSEDRPDLQVTKTVSTNVRIVTTTTQAGSTSTTPSAASGSTILQFICKSSTLPQFQQAFGKTVYQVPVTSSPTGPVVSSSESCLQMQTATVESKKFATKSLPVSVQPIAGNVIFRGQVPLGQTVSLIPPGSNTRQLFRITGSTHEQISLVKETVIQNKMSALLAAALQGKPKISEQNGEVVEEYSATRITLCRPGTVSSSRIVAPVQLQIPANVRAPQPNVSSTTLEQLREFDMVYNQVKERSNNFVQPDTNSKNSQEQQRISFTYVNQVQKYTQISPVVVVSSYNPLQPSLSSASVTSQAGSCITQVSTLTVPKVAVKSSKGKSIKNTIVKTSPPTVTTIPKPQQKPQEDEHTTQRIFDILAEYAEQLRNSPDLNNKPAPRRRSNPPTNPCSNSCTISPTKKKKKKSSNSSASPNIIETDNDELTIGSEDSSGCNTAPPSTTDEEQSQSAISATAESNLESTNASSPMSTTASTARPIIVSDATGQSRNVIITDSNISEALKMPNTALLMPGNYIMPVSVVKGGQHIAVVSGGNKILTTLPARSGQNMLLFQSFLNQNKKCGISAVKCASLQPFSGLSSQNVATVRSQPSVILPSNSIATVALSQPIAIKKIDNSEKGSNSEVFFTISQAKEVIKLEKTTDVDRPDSTNISHDSKAEENFHSTKGVYSIQKTNSVATSVIASAIKRDEAREQTSFAVSEAIKANDEPKQSDRNSSVLVNPPTSNGPMLSYTYAKHKKSAEVVESTTPPIKDFSRNTGKKQAIRPLKNNAVYYAIKTKKPLIKKDAEVQKQAAIERELRLQKTLSEECEDLGVDEPSTSDLFPEADLLFDTNHSPSYYQAGQKLQSTEAKPKSSSSMQFSDDENSGSLRNDLFEYVEYQHPQVNGNNSMIQSSGCYDATLLPNSGTMSEVTLSDPMSSEYSDTTHLLNKYKYKYSNRKKGEKVNLKVPKPHLDNSQEVTSTESVLDVAPIGLETAQEFPKHKLKEDILDHKEEKLELEVPLDHEETVVTETIRSPEPDLKYRCMIHGGIDSNKTSRKFSKKSCHCFKNGSKSPCNIVSPLKKKPNSPISSQETVTIKKVVSNKKR